MEPGQTLILLIDNYDSFAHNLARYFRVLGVDVQVARNDKTSSSIIAQINPQAIIISPGPCTPAAAGCSVAVVRDFCDSLPILGVCLGHQVVAAAFDAAVVRADVPMHGRHSTVEHYGDELFANIPRRFRAGRYHSLMVAEQRLPDCLVVTARSEDGTVMALAHRRKPVWGVQFHPESVLTEHGYRLLSNFLALSGIHHQVQKPHAVAPANNDTETAPIFSGRPLPMWY